MTIFRFISLGSGPVVLAGDAVGPVGANVVEGFQGRPVDPAAPAAGEVYVWGGASWAPGAVASGDVRGPTFIVGNSVAGDVASEVDYLDTGNGDMLRQALTDAAVAGGLVYVRRGDYALRGGAATLTVVAGNVTLMGEGLGTRLLLPRQDQMLCFQVQGRLYNCYVGMSGAATAALDDTAGNRFIEMLGGSIIRDCTIACIANNAAEAAFYPFFWSLLRATQPYASIQSCIVTTYSSIALGGGSEAIGLLAVGGFTEIIDTAFGDSGSSALIDVGAEIGESSGNRIVNSTVFNSRVAGVRVTGVFTNAFNAIRACRLSVASGSGVLGLFFGGAMNDVSITDTQISVSDGDGITFLPGVGESMDGLNIQNCNIIGPGAAGTGINTNTGGGGALTNMSDSLNRVLGFAVARSQVGVAPLIQVGNY